MRKRPKAKGARHALIIKDYVIRYVGSKRADLSSVIVHGERYLPPGLIRDGQIVNHDTLLPIVAECVAEWGLHKKTVQFCVPDSQVVVRNHKIDGNIPDDEVRGQLYFDLGESLMLPFEYPVFDYIVTGLKDGQKNIILFATKEQTINDYVGLFNELHLKSNAADLSSLSSYRMFHELEQTRSDGYSLLVQVDVTSTNITVFHEHKPEFSRLIPNEMTQENWKINRDVDGETLKWVGEEVELIRSFDGLLTEIEKVANFFQFNVLQGNVKIDQLLVCGDHPYLGMITEKMTKFYSTPLTTLDENKQLHLPLHYYDALGLILKKEVR